jgi:integrase/recombinase XerC
MEAWLRRLRTAGRGETTIAAYRHSIEDLLAWAQHTQRAGELFEERAIVDYLDDYKRRCEPAPATYHRRFVLLRRFMRWLSRSGGVPDPFLDLEAPPKPRQEDWLTREEFTRMLDAASRPERKRVGLVECDRLVLIALVMTGLRRTELLSLQWRDIDLDGRYPSLLVRRGKGGKPRRQPLASELADALRRERQHCSPSPQAPVFCGLRGGRLDPKILGLIIHRAARRAGIEKHVTAHMLRHTAATWLRQQTGDARLVAEYLGHADLSTVTRYAHVAPAELRDAAQAIANQAGIDATDLIASASDGSVQDAVWSVARRPSGESQAPAPSDPIEIATTGDLTLTPRISGN